jgi:aminoglycoside 3-N-acetyltransferase
MREIRLFKTKDHEWLTNNDILRALEKVDAHACRILCMHTELSFGMPNPELKRSELLQILFDIIMELGVPTLCVPTFTFSFCNNETYDVQNSSSKMGALNEYIRKLGSSSRSVDPLLSFAVVGDGRDLVEDTGHHSIGAHSTFDKLHHTKDVRFLFFGARLAECLTYTHYVEEQEQVPYRYNREFAGTVVNGGRAYQDTYSLFVRYANVIPLSTPKYEMFLLDNKLLKKTPCGDSSIASIDEPTAYATIAGKLRSDINYFLDAPYPRDSLDATFTPHKMVAL